MASSECITESLETQKLVRVFEVRVVFDDKQYLAQVCEQMLGKYITGYNLTENETGYIWDKGVEKKKNYVASTIVPAQKLNDVVEHLYREIKNKWETPLIQVSANLVNADFYDYLKMK